MSETPTPVEDVVVTGQRRFFSHETFPRERFVSVPPPPHMYDEKPMIEPMEDHQCSIARRRQLWDSDAAAAQAVPDMQSYAADPGRLFSIFSIEHGAYLIKTAAGIVPGNITHGTASDVTLDATGMTNVNWMGDIHTHPSGDGRPSQADWDEFLVNIGKAVLAQRTDIDDITFYVVVADTSSSRGYRIYAYNRNSDINAWGPEVDPDALPCP